MKYLLLLCSALMLSTTSLLAQPKPVDNSFEHWGKGVLAAEVADPEYSLMGYNALDGLDFYAGPGKKKLGQILSSGPEDLQLKFEAGETVRLNYLDQTMVSYEVNTLNWFQKRTGYVQIALNTFKKKIWLSEADLKEKGWLAWTYPDYVAFLKQHLFPERLEIRLNLRSAPNTQSKVLTTLSDDRFTVVPTGKVQGQWIEVDVTEIKELVDCGDKGEVVGQYTGWIKMVDDSGFPNIWFYAKGC